MVQGVWPSSPEPGQNRRVLTSDDTGTTIAGRLAAWLTERYGAPVSVDGPVENRGEGFDSLIYLVRYRSEALPAAWRQPLVLRVKSGVDRLDEARREAAIHDWVVARGYPAPTILAVLEPGVVHDRPVQVIERAGGVLALDQVRRAPWETRSISRQLAGLQVRLHGLDPAEFPAGDDLVDRRLGLTREVAARLDHRPLADALDAVDHLAPSLRAAPAHVCHGDFHPLNVLVDRGGARPATVIDWTDAAVGDRHGDVARTIVLFEMAPVAASNAAERAVLRVAGPRLARVYTREVDRLMPLDANRIDRWKPVHLLHGWSQALAVREGVFDPPGATNDDRRDRLPQGLEETLARRFSTALVAARSR